MFHMFSYLQASANVAVIVMINTTRAMTVMAMNYWAPGSFLTSSYLTDEEEELGVFDAQEQISAWL